MTDIAAKPYAVIDVGSNSVRLVVFEGLIRSPLPIFNERELCGLGQNLALSGRLDDEPVAAALAAVERFVALSRAMGAGDPRIVSTAAVREASNGAAFAQEVEQRTNVAVRVLDGREEARLSCLGVLSSMPKADGVMGDLGGGSLEVVGLEHGQMGEGITLPLGPLRISANAEKTGRALTKHIDETIARAPWLQDGRDRSFFAVGGAWRTLARIHQEQTNYSLHIAHHYELTAMDAENFSDLISRLSRQSLDQLDGVSAKRRSALPLAALVMARLVRYVKPARVVFSATGLREGLVFDQLDEATKNLDPLIEACRDFALHEGRFTEHGEELAQWMAPLFSSESGAQHRLRLAACLLADTAWRAHPDYRPGQAFRRILYAPLAGVNHGERAFLALAVFARYAGHVEDEAVNAARQLLAEEDRELAVALGLALRLGHVLSGGTPGIVGRSRLSVASGPLILTLIGDDAGLTGAAVSKRLTALGSAVGRSVRIDYAEE